MELIKQDFIISFFKGLDKKNINHCILRNYEKLPNEVGHDIDILIDGHGKHEQIKNDTISLIEQLGWEQFCNYDRDSFFTIICYKIMKDKVETLKLDIWTNLCWRGISWIDTKAVLEGRRKINGFYVPDKASEAAITSLKELMGGGDIPKKYYEKIISNATDNPELLVSILKNSFGNYSNIISEKLCSGDFESLNLMKMKLKNKLLFNNPSIYLKNTLQRILVRVMNVFDSPGKLIAFIGPDGSGKTSIINIEEEYLQLFVPNITKYHIRFNILPELRTGFGFSSMKGKLTNSQDKENINNVNKKPIKRSAISKLASWFIVIYYSIEFLIGRIIVKKHMINNSLILFDRYYYDFFAQPTTRDLIIKYKKLLMLFAKKPDIVIHLNANPEVVYKRKQELSINEIQNQNCYLKKTIEGLDNAYTINTDIKTEREIASDVFKIIIEKLKNY